MSDPSETVNQPLASTKLTVPFTEAVFAALLCAAEALRLEPTEIIQRATINLLIAGGFIAKDDAERIMLFRAVVDRAVTAAQELCKAGRFACSIALDAIHVCLEDSALLDGQPYTWGEGYRVLVGDDIYKNGNPEKGPVNREIGFRVRRGIGGIVEKDENGKPKTTKVLGEIIQSYTPIADFDRAAFGPRATGESASGSAEDLGSQQ